MSRTGIRHWVLSSSNGGGVQGLKNRHQLGGSGGATGGGPGGSIFHEISAFLSLTKANVKSEHVEAWEKMFVRYQEST